MKKNKLIRLAASAILCSSLLLQTVSASGLVGDLNGDGKITSDDCTALRKGLLDSEELSENADINGDGKITVADYVALRLHILGIKKIVQPNDRTVRTAVSLGCKYTLSGPPIGADYPDTYSLELTDGAYSDNDSYSSPQYVGFNTKGGEVGDIIVDLGKKTDGLNAFEFSFLSVNTAGIAPPSKVTVKISDDGKTWQELSAMKHNSNAISKPDKSTLELEEAVSARYVCFSYVAKAAWVFVDEVTVYADLPANEQNASQSAIYNAYMNDIADKVRTENLKSVISSVSPDTSIDLANISVGKKYTLSVKNSPISDMKDDGKKLTDGAIGSTFEDGSWSAFDAASEQIITVDLGSLANDISKLALSAFQRPESVITLPAYVDFEVSSDNKTFKSIARQYAPTAGKNGIYTFSFSADYCISARYVRFRMGASSGRVMLASEAAVYAHREVSSSVYPEVKLDTNDSGAWESPTTDKQNLIKGKDVQIEAYVNIDSLISPDDNTPATSKILTDGKNASSSYCYDGTWFHCLGAEGRYFYFDMGHVSAVDYATGGFLCNTGWAIHAPSLVTVYLSENGKDWYIAGSCIPNQAAGERRDKFRIDFDKQYKARYICFDVAFDVHLFIDELSVYGCTSTKDAVSLKDAGLEAFNKPSYDNMYHYQAPSKDLLHGVKDVVLSYYNNTVLDEEFFRPYAGYIVDGKAQDTMFDSFLFLPNPSALIKGGKPDFTSVKEEWEDLEDKLFIKGQNLDALNKAAGKVKDELGLSDYKYKFFVSIIHPSMHVKSFGDIDGDGKSEDLTTVEARLKVIQWYVERFYKMYDPAQYPNLEFAGWYWFHESIDTHEGDPEVIKAASDYLHTIGDQLFWIPYYCAEGYFRWKEVGFDVCCMQPNFAFNEDVGEGRIKSAVDIILKNNMCIEIEVDGKALTSDLFLQKYLGYLSGGVKHGYMTDAIHMYYESGGLFYLAYKSDTVMGHILYDYTYRFIKQTLTDTLEAPPSATLKCEEKTPVTHKVLEKDDYSIILIEKSPEHGSVTVNGDGTLTYYPGHGYKGTDSFMITTSDYISRSEAVEITVEIG